MSELSSDEDMKLTVPGDLTAPSITAGGKLIADVTGDITVPTITVGSLEANAENLTVTTLGVGGDATVTVKEVAQTKNKYSVTPLIHGI